MIAAQGSQALWFLTRGSGVVSLVLLTAVMVLGIAPRARLTDSWFGRFVSVGVHRSLSLLGVAFIVFHVATTVLDSFAPVRWLDAVVPFGSGYRPLWVGFGALAFDLFAALIVTSLLRDRIGYKTWRAVHWASYACWPIAVVHGLGAGSDVRSTWMLPLVAACTAAVLAASLTRVYRLRARWQGARVPLLAIGAIGTALIVTWVALGPLRSGWARVAGTPSSILAAKRAPLLPLPHDAAFSGTALLRNQDPTTGAVDLQIQGEVDGSPALDLGVLLRGAEGSSGLQVADGQIQLETEEGVRFTGVLDGITNGKLHATLRDDQGDQLQIAITLTSVNGQGDAAGTVQLASLS